MDQNTSRPRSKFFPCMLLLFSCCFGSAHAQISHLEVGGANLSTLPRLPYSQFRVLENEFGRLIKIYGTNGVIYLNDSDRKGLAQVVAFAKRWMLDQGYPEIKIIPLLGDYNKIELPEVTTASLNNPGLPQLTERMNVLIGPALVPGLERIAKHSRTGLRISSQFYTGVSSAVTRLKDQLSNEFEWVDTGEFGSDYISNHFNYQKYHPRPKVFVLQYKPCNSLLSRE